jgi:hypothetical protein
MNAATAAGLPADLDGGLWRLKLTAIRRLEAELLTVAKPSGGARKSSCAPSSTRRSPPVMSPTPAPG